MTVAWNMLLLDALAVHCMSQLGTFTRMQTKRTPVLSAASSSELSKNKIGLQGAGLDGEKRSSVWKG